MGLDPLLGLLKHAEKAITNLTCLNLSHETIVQIMQDEEDEEATMHTQTIQDRRKKVSRTITYEPPTTYEELKENLAQFIAAMLLALFTATCPLYV